MKKTVLILTIIFSLSLLSAFTYAVELPLRVVVNGEEVYFPDAQPFIDANGRTQTPARFIAEALGASVTWDGEARKATFEKGSNKLVLFIDKKEYELNGVKKQMDTAAIIKENRTFVPARYVAEAFGAVVSWDGAIRTVYIDVKKDSEVKEPTGTRIVSGFVVPDDVVKSLIVELKNDLNFETMFVIDFFRPNVEKQKNDMEKLLLQKFSEDTVKQIMDHIRPKMGITDAVVDKTVFDSRTSQYIAILRSESYEETITVWIYKKGIKP